MMVKVKSGLLDNLWFVVKTSGSLPFILLTMAGFMISGYINFKSNQTLIQMTGVRERQEGLQLLVWLTTYYIINSWWVYFVKMGRRRYITTPIKRFVNNHYWTLMEKADVEWYGQLETKKDHPVNVDISSGTYALTHVIDTLIDIIEPIVQLCSSVSVLCVVAGRYSVVVLGFVLVLVLLGCVLLRWNYHTQKVIKKQTAPQNEYVRTLATNFLIEIINGHGGETKKLMLDTIELSHNLDQNHRIRMSNYYSCIEGVQTILIGCGVWLISGIDNLYTVGGVYTIVNSTCNKSWWLFNRIHDMFITGSDWGCLESILEEYQETKPIVIAKLLDPTTHIPDFERCDKIRLHGDSGCGKTTYMRRLLEIIHSATPNQVVYLTQNANVPKASHITAFRYLTMFVRDKIDPTILKQKVLEYCDHVGLSGLINEETIDQPFVKPSGGEQKRLVVLQRILPLLINPQHHGKKLVCLDEVSTGLDLESRNSMYRLLNTLTGVKMLVIDHDISVEFVGVTKNVKSRKIPDLEVVVKKQSTFWRDIGLIKYILSFYTDKSKKPPTKIKQRPDVWLSDE